MQSRVRKLAGKRIIDSHVTLQNWAVDQPEIPKVKFVDPAYSSAVCAFFLKASRFERLGSIGGYFLWWKLFSGKTVIRYCGQVNSRFIVLSYLIYGQPSADLFN